MEADTEEWRAWVKKRNKEAKFWAEWRKDQHAWMVQDAIKTVASYPPTRAALGRRRAEEERHKKKIKQKELADKED